MEKDILVLAVESSCDETSVAVIKNGTEILSNVVASQIESHKRFGGVVPEVASRHHVESVTLVFEEALKVANVTWDDIDAITVTEGPGLIGSLLIGINAAKALAFAHDIPLVGVHHIAGHIYANQLVEPLEFPLLALVVSGGHTELVYMKDHYQFEVIGETLDDAVGEAYDKVARTLSLPYPGGPHIDRLAAVGEDTYKLPRVWLDKESYDFSFSGLKSAVINTVHNAKQRGEEIVPENLAASFQASVVEVLVEKTMRAAREYNVKQIIVAGGVSANKGLRKGLEEAVAKDGHIKLTVPPLSLCTDNAAMIGVAAYYEYMKGSVMEEVRRMFKPEFLNRIDDIMVFHVLNKEDIRKIVTLLLKTLEKRCAEQMEIHLTVTNAVKDFIAEKGSDNKYGARPLRRAIQSRIEDALANEILEGRVKRGDSVQVKLHKNEIAFEVKKQ